MVTELTVVPFAARATCEMWLIPKRHQPDFGDLQNGEIKVFVIALRDAFTRLRAALDDPPYNYVIDTAAKDGLNAPHLHWRLRIMPHYQPFSARRGRDHLALVPAVS